MHTHKTVDVRRLVARVEAGGGVQVESPWGIPFAINMFFHAAVMLAVLTIIYVTMAAGMVSADFGEQMEAVGALVRDAVASAADGFTADDLQPVADAATLHAATTFRSREVNETSNAIVDATVWTAIGGLLAIFGALGAVLVWGVGLRSSMGAAMKEILMENGVLFALAFCVEITFLYTVVKHYKTTTPSVLYDATMEGLARPGARAACSELDV